MKRLNQVQAFTTVEDLNNFLNTFPKCEDHPVVKNIYIEEDHIYLWYEVDYKGIP